MFPHTPRTRPPFASPTCNPSGPLGWGRGPETYDQPAAPEPRRSPRSHLSLKENLSQRSCRLLPGGRGVFPGQLGGGQRDDGARRGALSLAWHRRTDLRAARGREKCRHAAVVTKGPGLIALALACSSNTPAGRRHRLQSKAQGLRGQLVFSGSSSFPSAPAAPIISQAGRPTGTSPDLRVRASFIPCAAAVKKAFGRLACIERTPAGRRDRFQSKAQGLRGLPELFGKFALSLLLVSKPRRQEAGTDFNPRRRECAADPSRSESSHPEPDAFTAARLALPLLQVEELS